MEMVPFDIDNLPLKLQVEDRLSVAREMNLNFPFYKLPDDILVTIFEYAREVGTRPQNAIECFGGQVVASSAAYAPGKFRKPSIYSSMGEDEKDYLDFHSARYFPLNLIWVCQRWAKIFMEYSCLWSHVQINDTRYTTAQELWDETQTFFELSGDHHLTLTVIFEDISNIEIRHEDPHARLAARHQVAERVLAESHRWKNVHFRVYKGLDIPKYLQRVANTAATSPFLKSLVLEGGRLEPLTGEFLHHQNLQALSLMGVHNYDIEWTFDFPNLRQLHLETLLIKLDIHEILRGLPKLRSLNMHGCVVFEHEELHGVLAHRLESLIIHLSGTVGLDKMLPPLMKILLKLRLPNLHKFYCGGLPRSDRFVAALNIFVQDSYRAETPTVSLGSNSRPGQSEGIVNVLMSTPRARGRYLDPLFAWQVYRAMDYAPRDDGNVPNLYRYNMNDFFWFLRTSSFNMIAIRSHKTASSLIATMAWNHGAPSPTLSWEHYYPVDFDVQMSSILAQLLWRTPKDVLRMHELINTTLLYPPTESEIKTKFFTLTNGRRLPQIPRLTFLKEMASRSQAHPGQFLHTVRN